MFYDIKDFPILEEITRNYETINQELNAAKYQNELIRNILNPIDNSLDYYTDYWVKDNGFHEEQLGYDIRNGQYSTLAIYKKDFQIKSFDSTKLFSKTLELIKDLPGVHYSGFFKMNPNTKLGSHKHNRKHLIFHLLLEDLKDGDCVLTCGGKSFSVKYRGDSLLFDYSYEHGSVNNSSTERLHFIVDFDPFTK